MPRKPSQKTLKRKADLAWSKIIRSKGYCEWCRTKNSGFEAAHIVSRTYSKTRHLLKNGLCLCHSCHRLAHKKPTLFTEFLQKTIGQEALDFLHTESNRTDYKVDYQEVLDFLNTLVE